MSRKVVDYFPEITIGVGKDAPRYSPQIMTLKQAEDARDEVLALIKRHVDTSTRRNLDIEAQIVEDARCEHCNALWTERSADYNGGCCDKDEEAAP